MLSILKPIESNWMEMKLTDWKPEDSYDMFLLLRYTRDSQTFLSATPLWPNIFYS